MHPTRRIALLLVLVAPLSIGSRCAQGPGGAPREQPLAELVAAGGHVDPQVYESLVARIEERRGLRFVRRPLLALVTADDERLAGLRVAGRDTNRCLPDLAGASVVCVATVEADGVALALAQLLDEQHYPELVARAERLAGDPGRALRALLAASAEAAARQGIGPPFEEIPPGLLEQETLEVERTEATETLLPLAATLLLRAQRDREAPFRDPPLSTRQLLSPRDYRAGIRPVLLRGTPPEALDCEPVTDESVGPAALLTAVTRVGGTVPAAPLAAWRGDRAVQLACRDDRKPWIYAAEFDDPAAAASFAASAEAFLPGSLPRPFALLVASRRVLVWHDIGRDRAIDWAAQLRPVELRSLDQLESHRPPFPVWRPASARLQLRHPDRDPLGVERTRIAESTSDRRLRVHRERRQRLEASEEIAQEVDPGTREVREDAVLCCIAQRRERSPFG